MVTLRRNINRAIKAARKNLSLFIARERKIDQRLTIKTERPDESRWYHVTFSGDDAGSR